MKTIEITFKPDGSTELHTTGYAGAECQKASKFIEDALGEKIGEKRTAEFYQPAKQEQHQQQR